MGPKGITFLFVSVLFAFVACDRGAGDESSAAPSAPVAEAPAAQGGDNAAPAANENEGQGNEGGAPRSFDSAPAAGTRAHCVVMGHDFTVNESTLTSEHNGRHYAFCCPSCKPRFDANPGEFI